MAKSLKLGVCRTMAREGPLDGLFTGKFIFLVMTCAGVLVWKGLIISYLILFTKERQLSFLVQGNRTYNYIILIQTLLVFGLFIPQTLLATFSTIGWSKASLKILLQHPYLILLPTFTFFTFAKVQTGFGPQDVRIKFSKKFTCYNMVLTSIYIAMIIYLFGGIDFDVTLFVFFYVFIITIGVLPTTIFLLYDKLCCCCCSCCLQPREEVVGFDPEWPDKDIWDITDMGLVVVTM